MPELPEMEALAEDLAHRASGQQVTAVGLGSLSALRTYSPALGELVGSTVAGVQRRGKFLCLRIGDCWLVAHLALAGWVHWRDRAPTTKVRPGTSPLALRLVLDGGSCIDVTEMGTQKRVALWLVDDPGSIEPVAALGPDAWPDPPGIEWFSDLLTGQTGTVKTVLTTQSLIAGIGNAYSDEILHAAHLSPFRPANRLTGAEVAILWAAMREVLSAAVDRARGLSAADLKAEKKQHLSVHGRTGEPCPVCGDRVREVSFSTRSLQYCPTCQTGGRVLADRRLSRLLK